MKCPQCQFEWEPKPLAIGERVRVYHHEELEAGSFTLDGWKAEVIGLQDGELVLVRGLETDVDGVIHEHVVHRKQCRRILSDAAPVTAVADQVVAIPLEPEAPAAPAIDDAKIARLRARKFGVLEIGRRTGYTPEQVRESLERSGTGSAPSTQAVQTKEK